LSKIDLTEFGRFSAPILLIGTTTFLVRPSAAISAIAAIASASHEKKYQPAILQKGTSKKNPSLALQQVDFLHVSIFYTTPGVLLRGIGRRSLKSRP